MHLVANDRQIRPRKTHTAEFKEKVVKAFLNTSATYTEVGRKFGVTCPQVARWTREYNDPSTRWVKELCDISPNESLTDTSLIQNEQAESTPIKQDSNFNIDVSLPSGTKISINNINSVQLQSVLKLFQSMYP